MPKIPSKEECLQLLKKYNALETIVEHSLQVAKVAVYLGERLVANGENIDLQLLEAAALLHDIDKKIILDDDSKKHALEAEKILKKEGFPQIAAIVIEHRLGRILEAPFSSWEAKLVYYADKRVKHARIVSLEERFEYLLERYGKPSEKIKGRILRAKPKVFDLEEEIFSKINASKDLSELNEERG